MDFGSAFNLIIKFGSLTLLLVYLVFAVLVVRQIDLMVRTFSTPYEGRIRWLGWIHLGLSVGVLLLAVIV